MQGHRDELQKGGDGFALEKPAQGAAFRCFFFPDERAVARPTLEKPEQKKRVKRLSRPFTFLALALIETSKAAGRSLSFSLFSPTLLPPLPPL